MPLNPKQQAFVREYLVDLNATQAAIRAGYSKKTAKSIGSENLTKPDVQAAIAQARTKADDDAIISREEILKELKRVGLSDAGQILDENGNCRTLNEMPEDIRRCISSVKFSGDGGTEVKFWPKTTALELLGKHKAMWTDKTEVTGKGGGPVEFIINGVVPE